MDCAAANIPTAVCSMTGMTATATGLETSPSTGLNANAAATRSPCAQKAAEEEIPAESQAEIDAFVKQVFDVLGMTLFVFGCTSLESAYSQKWYVLRNIRDISTGETGALCIDTDKLLALIRPVREVTNEDFNDLKDAIMSSAQRQLTENKTIGSAFINSYNKKGIEQGYGEQGSLILGEFITEMLSHPKGDAFSWMQCPKELRETLQDAFSNSPGLKEAVEEIFP